MPSIQNKQFSYIDYNLLKAAIRADSPITRSTAELAKRFFSASTENLEKSGINPTDKTVLVSAIQRKALEGARWSIVTHEQSSLWNKFKD